MVTLEHELTLSELLHDPLVRVVMDRDGIDVHRFERLFDRHRRDAPPGQTATSARLTRIGLTPR